MKIIEVLAKRAYPGLHSQGCCSRHRNDGHYDCKTCYPDWKVLMREHQEVFNKLYDDLLELSGLSDPPNGRIGTNRILETLKDQLEHQGKKP